MRPLAVSAAVLTVLVLVLPRHGTPSERPADTATPAVGRGPTGNPGLPGRSLGVSLAAEVSGSEPQGDPPVQTITITLPAKAKRPKVQHRRRNQSGPWQTATASAYSAASTRSTVQGCPGAPPLTDRAVSFASLIVPCGARVDFCAGRCVVAVRTDSGPYVGGRSFDLNVGTVHALIGSWSPFAWGVRTVRWRRAR